MTQQFNHQLEILLEGNNLNTNSVDNRYYNRIPQRLGKRKKKLLSRGTEDGQTFSKTNFHRKTNIKKSTN